MKTKLIIDGNAVYEIDEECVECKKKQMAGRNAKQDMQEKYGRKRGGGNSRMS